MFEKLMGKRKKEPDFFHIPEKKYTTDPKIIGKMGTGALKDLLGDQEKYVGSLIEKLEQGRGEYDRLTDKLDELAEKNEVVHAQVARMTNQHEELSIKFDNLQASLEMVSSENDLLCRKELAFLNDQEVPTEKIKTLPHVLTLYRERLSLCRKIEQQNRSLKGRLSDLQEDLEQTGVRLQELEREKNYNNLIPTLMQEIQELRQNSVSAESRKQQDLQQHLSHLENTLVHKVKSELETAALKSTEEEDFQEKNRATTLELRRVTQELHNNNLRIQELQQKNQELACSYSKASEKIKILEADLSQSKNLLTKGQQEASQLNVRLQAAEEGMRRQAGRRAGVEEELRAQKASGSNLEDFLAEINTVLQSKQSECSRLHEELQAKEQLISSKQQELAREREDREGMEALLSNKNDSELDGLLKIKSRNEAELQELRQSMEALRLNGDSLKRSAAEWQARAKQAADEAEGLRNANKRLAEEKLVIQENSANCLKISQEESQRLRAAQKEWGRKCQELKKEAEGVAGKLRAKEDEARNLTAQTEKLFKALQAKEAEARRSQAAVQQLQREKASTSVMIGQKEEDHKIRMRKYESELNQERIKLQSLNRKLASLESRGEESKASMDAMYEQLLAKDKKIVHMETKLKEYKYIIQVQKKEKQELEEAYEKALLKPNHQDPPEPRKDSKPPVDTLDHEKENLRNELVSAKEQNVVLLAENEGLRRKIEEMEENMQEKSRNIKVLQEKRDQIMKEIEKMNKKPLQSDHLPLPSPPMRVESKEEGRERKIAAKAYKGFDILLKLQHQLYKNFINVFATDLARQEVKAMEGDLNSVIKKSSEMKDIFEDYL